MYEIKYGFCTVLYTVSVQRPITVEEFVAAYFERLALVEEVHEDSFRQKLDIHLTFDAQILKYRVFIKNCVFSLKFCDFSELCQLCYSAGKTNSEYF